MKKFLQCLCALLSALMVFSAVCCFSVSALGGSSSISFSNSTPSVDSSVTVTANFRFDERVNAIEAYITYDPSILQYTGGAGTNSVTAGKVKIVVSGDNNTFSVPVSFKAVGSGKSLVALESCLASNGSASEASFSGASTFMSVAGNSSSSSETSSSVPATKTNADLSSITVADGTLSPAFSRTVTEYTVVVANKVTDGTLYCKAVDGKAKLAFGGERNLAVGLTKRTITVTASDGTKKVYTVTFNRLDENGKDTTVDETKTGPQVTVDGKTMRITDTFDQTVLPVSLTLTVYNYEGVDVSALTDSTGTLTVLYLADEQNNGAFYLYDKQKGFSPFRFFDTAAKTYVFLDLDSAFSVPAGFTVGNVPVGQMTVPCYLYSDSRYNGFAVVRVLSANGNTAYYRYDTTDGTLQLYPEFTQGVVSVSAKEEKSTRDFVVIILLLLAAELLIAVIVVLIVMLARHRRKPLADDTNYDVLMDADFTIENVSEKENK